MTPGPAPLSVALNRGDILEVRRDLRLEPSWRGGRVGRSPGSGERQALVEIGASGERVGEIPANPGPVAGDAKHPVRIGAVARRV